MLSGHEVVTVNPAVATQDTGDELVVVLPDQGKYVVLNATGAKVLQLADGKQTLIEIATVISDSFGKDLEQVKNDVLAFATDLLTRGILSIVEAEAN